MEIHSDLERLRRRINVIEIELEGARKQLVALEARLEMQSRPHEPPSADPAPMIVPERPETVVRPPPLPRDTFADPAPEVPRVSVPAESRAVFSEVSNPVAKEDEDDAGTACRNWLQRLQLWPPEDGENNEVRLGAWWATRLGTLLAVIGVVFFGVYVSLDTPPWVKFVELCTICGAVAGAGLWLERRIPRFGAVVFGGGLALVYFCAFAGYALPPVKVLFNPAAAAGWQIAAVALIALASVGRRSVSIATMAVALGYVTAIFSRAGGLHEFALVTAALLAGAAVGFHRLMTWEAPSVVALPGAYALYGLVLHGNWFRGEAPGNGWPWIFLVGIGTLFFARDWRGTRARNEPVGAGERLFQGGNSTLGVVFGVITALTLYREALAEFYFGAGLLLVVFAVVRRRLVADDVIGAVFVVKAAGAFTLGVIEVAEVRTTALVLMVQAWVMLWSARRLASRVLAVGTGVVGLLALAYFFAENLVATPLVSWRAAGVLAFITGVAWLAAEGKRAISKKPFPGGTVIELSGALMASVVTWAVVRYIEPSGWRPALMMGTAVFLGAGAARRPALAPFAAMVVLMVAANVSFWRLVEGATGDERLIGNAAAVLLPSGILAALLGSTWMRARTTGGRMAEWGALMGIVTLAGMAHVFSVLMTPTAALATMGLVALMLGGVSSVWRRRHLCWLATASAAFGFLFWREAGAVLEPEGWLAVAVGAMWALPIGLHAMRRHREEMETEPKFGWLVGLQVGLALLITAEVLPSYFSGPGLVLAVSAIALGVFGLTRWPGIGAGLEGSWVMWMIAIWTIAKMFPGRYPQNDYDLRLVVAALLAWAPAVALSFRGVDVEAPWWRRGASGVQTTIATVIAVFVCLCGYREAGLLVAFVAAAAVAVLALRLGRVMAARRAALILMLCALGAAWMLAIAGDAEGAGSGLAAVGLVAAASVALPLVVGGGWHGVFGFGALGLCFLTAVAQRGTLAPYATVGWGIASIVLFMTGLFARTRAYRMLGLAGLAVCVPRVFLVDLDSALHRIIAFVVLGLVLLWVGFSYHRFRHLVAEEPGKNKSL